MRAFLIVGEDEHRIVVFSDGKEAGFLEYTEEMRDGEKCWDACHTVTSPEFRGQGIAKVLVDELAKYAREEGVKVIPTCSYVQRKFSEDEIYDDIAI